jgi:hypothetical protein
LPVCCKSLLLELYIFIHNGAYFAYPIDLNTVTVDNRAAGITRSSKKSVATQRPDPLANISWWFANRIQSVRMLGSLKNH